MANRICIGKDNTSPDWYGLKIGKPGINVLGTNNINNLLWSTDFPKSFDIIMSGSWSMPDATLSQTINFPGAPLPEIPLVVITQGASADNGDLPGIVPTTYFDNGDETANYPMYWASVSASNLLLTKVGNDYFNTSGMNIAGRFFVIRW